MQKLRMRTVTTLSRVDSNVHSESAAATHAMAILPILYLSSSDARSKVVVKVETKNARKPSNVFVLASFIFIDPKLRPISHANVSPIPTAINPDKDFITLLLLLPLT
ncbi:unnamed protein product [Bathycoccus prasinos]